MAEFVYISYDKHKEKIHKEEITLDSEFNNDGMKITLRTEKGLTPIGHIILDKTEVAHLLMLDFDPRN